jgi:hypothetical protein
MLEVASDARSTWVFVADCGRLGLPVFGEPLATLCLIVLFMLTSVCIPVFAKLQETGSATVAGRHRRVGAPTHLVVRASAWRGDE